LILDEDKLLDVMEPIMAAGGNIVDYHSCDLFPERWFDLVLVLKADTEILYDRLVARGYSKKKIDENMECEIMQIVAESAHESYEPEIVHFLDSNTLDDMESNISRMMAWYSARETAMNSN
jgi:adenylate kinase